MSACKDVFFAFLAIVFALAVGFTMDIASETNLSAKKARLPDAVSSAAPQLSAIQITFGEDDFLCRKS